MHVHYLKNISEKNFPFRMLGEDAAGFYVPTVKIQMFLLISNLLIWEILFLRSSGVINLAP